MLAPNEQIFEVVNGEIKITKEFQLNKYLASPKLDGIRCIFYAGEMLSRSLKPIKNKQLNERFDFLKQLSNRGFTFDGEIYSSELEFNDISAYCRTENLEDVSSCSKCRKDLPESLKFYCFDMLHTNKMHEIFCDRCNSIYNIERDISGTILGNDKKYFVRVPQYTLSSEEELNTIFKQCINNKCDGVILKASDSVYKFGRATVKEATMFKVKPYETFDSIVVGYELGTVVKQGVTKTINELGNSVTSRKKGDRETIESLSALHVNHKGKDLKVSLSSLTEIEREELYKIRETLIGGYIEYKGLSVGAKDLPRHPVFIRFRGDKNF